MNQQDKSPRFAALRYPAFRNLWIGLLLSNIGGQMQVVGQGWLVREMHHEPIYFGLIALSSALPMILLTPIAGAIVDRFPRLRLLVVTHVCAMLQALLLAALTLVGLVEYWHLLVFGVIQSALLGLNNPGRQSILPDLVPKERLTGAVSLFSTGWSASALVGPALGGVLLGFIGSGGLFVTNGLSYGALVWALFRLPRIPTEQPARKESLLQSAREGLSYALTEPVTLRLLLLLSATNLLGRSYTHVMPILAVDVLRTGPIGYGLLLAAPGLGAITGGMAVAAARSIARPYRLVFFGVTGVATSLFAFAMSRSILLSMALLFLTAVASTLVSTGVTTTLQMRVPNRLRGRTMSLVAVSNIGMGQLGSMGVGSLAMLTGVPGALALSAAILAVLWSIAAGRMGAALAQSTADEDAASPRRGAVSHQ